MRTRLILFGVILLFAAVSVFAQEKGFTLWMNSSKLSTMSQEMNQNRMFPGIVEGRLYGTAIQFRAKFVPFLPNMEYFQSRWGITENLYNAYNVQFMKTGFTELSHTSFVDRSGTTLHQVTWVLIPKHQKQHKSSGEMDL